jgi:hypothetical protein
MWAAPESEIQAFMECCYKPFFLRSPAAVNVLSKNPIKLLSEDYNVMGGSLGFSFLRKFIKK